MPTGHIAAIYRYPVKSMAGESITQVTLSSAGLPGDRAWAVRDEVRGGIRGAKKLPGLMQLPADALDHYRRGAPEHEDLVLELRTIFGREPDEPLPDIGRFPPELLEFESPPGSYFDAFPLLILSRQSLGHMQEKAPGSRFDVRRFRPNLVVDAPGEAPFPELDWQGRRLRVGSAVLTVTMECPRCVMTTHGFADLPRDPKVMRALVEHAGGNLGAYARVEEPGEIQVDDPIEILG